MRTIVLVIGILVALIGLSELVTGHWWVGVASSIVSSSSVRWFGLAGVLIGLILFVAAHRRLVGLRDIMALLGLLMIVVGVYITINPGFWNRMTTDIFISQPAASQARLLIVTGLIRLIIGAAIIYSVVRWSPTEQGEGHS